MQFVGNTDLILLISELKSLLCNNTCLLYYLMSVFLLNQKLTYLRIKYDCNNHSNKMFHCL